MLTLLAVNATQDDMMAVMRETPAYDAKVVRPLVANYAANAADRALKIIRSRRRRVTRAEKAKLLAFAEDEAATEENDAAAEEDDAADAGGKYDDVGDDEEAGVRSSRSRDDFLTEHVDAVVDHSYGLMRVEPDPDPADEYGRVEMTLREVEDRESQFDETFKGMTLLPTSVPNQLRIAATVATTVRQSYRSSGGGGAAASAASGRRTKQARLLF